MTVGRVVGPGQEATSVETRSSWHDGLSLTHRHVDLVEEVADLNLVRANWSGTKRI